MSAHRFPGAGAIVFLLPLIACSTTPAPTATPQPSPLSCDDVRWTNVRSERLVTDVRLVVVDESGAVTETQVDGFPKQLAPSAGTTETVVLAGLIRSLGEQVPDLNVQPGPSPAPLSALGDEPEPGRYLIYEGAALVTADYSGQCATSGNVPIQGTLTTWTDPTDGGLACAGDQKPPEGSFGAEVEHFCEGAD